MSKKRINKIVGPLGAIFATSMFVAYIPQILSNLKDIKSQPIQPLIAFFSCVVWFLYGVTKDEKDWAIIIPNSVGSILCLIAFLTSL